MKLVYTTLSVAVLLMACGPKTESTNSTTTDTNKVETPVDTADKPIVVEPAAPVLLTAHGSNPSWTLSMTKTTIKFKLADRDTVTASEYVLADNSNAETEYYTGGKDFGITVKNKPVTEAGSGKKYSKDVTISFQGKKYKGVGGDVVTPGASVPETKPDGKKPVTDTDNKAPETQGRITINGEWILSALNGTKVTDKDFSKGLATLDINTVDNTGSGFGGCNRFSCSLTIFDGKKIKIDKIMATKMFCEGIPENKYTTALRNATNFAVENNKLILKNNGGTALATFVRGVK